ncbi:signal transduction protein [Thiohalobacter thiocyanaticus]|uniref:Signal transduction protein n=2 Tax=Thiohalobacter thiocyanaticus TaxID=585455 RepID=A0A1Z4VLQ6_9GAMM|nr:signal transduction protein [Thiohalobacter thiocyanaticus]
MEDFHMETIKQLLQDKGGQVWTILPQASVYDAIYLMSEKEIGSLLVVEDERIVGLISERDYARKVILKGRSSKSTRVSDIMSRSVLYTHGGQTIHEAMAVMTKHRIRHLPALEDGRLIGIVSMGDLVNALIAEQQFIIEQLEHYITG